MTSEFSRSTAEGFYSGEYTVTITQSLETWTWEGYADNRLAALHTAITALEQEDHVDPDCEECGFGLPSEEIATLRASADEARAEEMRRWHEEDSPRA